MPRVQLAVDTFFSIVEQEQEIYANFGIPTSLIYRMRAMKEGKKIEQYQQISTISELRLALDLNLNDVVEAEVYSSLSVYLCLKIKYGDSIVFDSCEMLMHYQICPLLLDDLRELGYDTEYYDSPKSMGYGYHYDGSYFVKIAEGYPNTSRYDFDIMWLALRTALDNVLPKNDSFQIQYKATSNNETKVIGVESKEYFYRYLMSDGIQVFTDVYGRIMLRCLTDIHGNIRSGIMDANTGDYLQFSGMYLTNITVPKLNGVYLS